MTDGPLNPIAGQQKQKKKQNKMEKDKRCCNQAADRLSLL